MSERGESPARLAWLRLRANLMAMLSLAILVIIVAATIAAPLVAPQDPDQQHTWIGAQPPGFTHPEVLSRNRLAVGEAAELPPSLRTATHVRVLLREQTHEELRITLRRGAVAAIMRLPGPVAMQELAFAESELTVLNEQGVEEPRTVAGVARVGEIPPAGLFVEGERALIVRLRGTAVDTEYQATLAEGVCTHLERAGVAIDAASLLGADIQRIEADGKPRHLVHLLGTDALGRDCFSRVLHGGRISLLVGAVATAVSLIIGVLYGAVAGYRGGRVDRAMMGGVDVLYALPFMFLVILLLTLFGRSLILLFVALGAVQWLTMARIVRSQVLSMAGSEFIAAARLSGASSWRILTRHLIPNCAGPVIVYATLTVPAVIMEESFLAFLGLGVGFEGVQIESWGALVHAGAQATNHPWLLFVPATMMAVTLLALNILGDGLRDALDPRLEGR